jgi:hypothetical protein
MEVLHPNIIMLANFQQQMEVEMSVEIDTDDAKAFGADAWVHCGSHGRPHRTGWCTVNVRNKTLLKATNFDDAVKECKARGLWLYGHQSTDT